MKWQIVLLVGVYVCLFVHVPVHVPVPVCPIGFLAGMSILGYLLGMCLDHEAWQIALVPIAHESPYTYTYMYLVQACTHTLCKHVRVNTLCNVLPYVMYK